MRLLLDEMLSPVIARELQARGYDVQAVAAHPQREASPIPRCWRSREPSGVLWLRTTCVISARYT